MRPPRWFLDLSVSTCLKGAQGLLDDFRFVLTIETAAAMMPSRRWRFQLTRPGTLYHPAIGEIEVGRAWLVMEDADHIRLKDDGMLFGGFGDELDECVGPVVSQTTVSVGSGVMRRLLGEYAEERDGRRYRPAVFDVRLEAFDGAGALLVDNRIRIRVCHHLGSSV